MCSYSHTLSNTYNPIGLTREQQLTGRKEPESRTSGSSRSTSKVVSDNQMTATHTNQNTSGTDLTACKPILTELRIPACKDYAKASDSDGLSDPLRDRLRILIESNGFKTADISGLYADYRGQNSGRNKAYRLSDKVVLTESDLTVLQEVNP